MTEKDLARFWSFVQKTEGCWLWTGATTHNGYGAFGIGPNKVFRAHRVSWRIHNGADAGDLQVLHRCDVRNCVRPDHLFLGTPKDNTQDMVAKDREPSGERSGTHKLTAAEVVQIRHLYSTRSTTHITQRELAQAFNINQGEISRIVNNKTWRKP